MHRKRLRFVIAIGIVCVIGLVALQGHDSPQSSLQSHTQTWNDTNTTKPLQTEPTAPTITPPIPFNGMTEASVFIPYWLVNQTNFRIPNRIDASLTTLIYFGVAATDHGINTEDPGYRNLSTFLENTAGSGYTRLLTLRMLDESTNTHILRNPQDAEHLIDQTVSLARTRGFDGIVLDLEHSVLPTKDVIQNITHFTRMFAEEARQHNLSFAVTLFGDTYYRLRPYDVATIGNTVDHAYIMAYDFHKSFGQPGPNFPTYQTETYAYSFERMMIDFLADVPAEKISLVLGMFGYDWSVDDQNRPAKAANPLTLNQVEARFYPTCPFAACTITPDPDSMETEITYTDETGQKHTVWFENEASAEIKTTLARQYGFSHVGFWAHGYY